MSTTLNSSIINVNILKLKKDLEDLGDIKVLSIEPKAGVIPTRVTMVRGNGFSNLTSPQQIAAQAVIDAHVDQQLENLDFLGETELVIGTRADGLVKIQQGGNDTWKFEEISHDFIPLQVGLSIGNMSFPVGNIVSEEGTILNNFTVQGDLVVDGTINGGGGGANLVDNEIPIGAIDGINTVYTTAFDFATNSLKVFLNGIRLRSGVGNDYTITDVDEFTLNYAPTTGENLIVDYIKT